MNISSIMDVSELERLVNERYISARTNGPYTLYNYSEKATFDRVWTDETRQCRGIITTADGEIVAWPFDKFFNLDEAEETRMSALEARQGPVSITEKLDGSMIAVWHHDGSWHTSTRGAFDSTQAQAAAWWLAARPIDLDILKEFTLLCEWCAPDNRIVLKYDTADLTLIGARLTSTGTDIHYEQLEHIARLAGLRLVPHTTESLSYLAEQRGARTGMEGWVARWPDGFRVKIKTEDYLRLHRIVSLFSPARVLEGLIAGDNYIAVLPEELRAEAEAIEAAILEAAAHKSAHLMASFNRLRPLLSDGRKAYALGVLQEPADDRPFLFSLADNKPVREKILQSIDLARLFPAA